VNAQPFDLASCPRVRARQARATRSALRACARLPARWMVALPPLGEATMSFGGFDPGGADADAVDFTISFGSERGRVSIESAFAVRLVDAVLGGEAIFSPARSAGPAERGLLAGVLAPAFDRLGGTLNLDPVAPGGGRDGQAAGLVFLLQTVVGSGWLRLTPPGGDWFALPDVTDVWRALAARVPLTAAMQLASTGVPAGAFAGVVVGDAIVFDGARAAAFAADVPWNARLRVGGHAAEIAVEVGGKVSLAGGFSPVRREETNMSASDSNTDATTVLGAASIEIVAELGRIALRGDELLGLAPGAVVALGAQRKGVTLRVGGEVWAEGEIVDIEGELGVRVTRIANR
jgi:flagellar motor switch/type III secretory pathway protein FliN